eukprot:gene6779-9286_t
MFSPMGKKKLLLQMKLGKLPEEVLKSTAKISPSKEFIKSTNNRLSATTPVAVVASSTSLENALLDFGATGKMMNKIMEATVRYRPERDSVMLKAFQHKSIPYELFRSNLNSVFWISLTEEEFSACCSYFDPSSLGSIDGYEFMISFVRLMGILKDREAQKVREKQEAYENKVKEDAERKKLELSKQIESIVDFNYSDEAKQQAMYKLHSAAVKFDPNHPASPSLECFDINSMKPNVFREMLKRTFNLKLDKYELGAVMKLFAVDGNNPSEVKCEEFVRYFLKIGYDSREKDKMYHRRKQQDLAKKAEEEHIQKLKQNTERLAYSIDYNFNNNDEITAMEKLKEASAKYDKNAPGCVALDGFECESLSPGDFKDLIRRVFNVSLSPTELGYVIKKYDLKKNGNVFCKPFLNDFMKMGQEVRHKHHLEQLERQRLHEVEEQESHEKKVKEVKESETINIDFEFTDDDLQAGLNKLTDAAIHYDSVRGVSLISFEPNDLSPREFKKAIKKTFNLKLQPKELGAIVNYFDHGKVNRVHCQTFLNTFTVLGASERGKIRSEQLKAQREAELARKEEHAKKILDLSSSVSIETDFSFTEEEEISAMNKLREAATKYDASHPASLGLDGFNRRSMAIGEFKELVRRTFNLKLTVKEVAALFKLFDKTDTKRPVSEIDCGDFLQRFLQMGIAERAKFHREQLEKQREENRQREILEKKKVEDLASRSTYKVDSNFSEEDKNNILQKIAIAAESFDKNHPAAPSLQAFEVLFMPPGLFRENFKKVFNVQTTPKEMGYLLSEYDKENKGLINVQEFMLKFTSLGKNLRFQKRKEFLENKRELEKLMQLEEERKRNALWEAAEMKIDHHNFTSDDYYSAELKMIEASRKYDKTHPSAPNLSGFSGGPIKPGIFRELMKRAFSIQFTGKELGAITHRFEHIPNNGINHNDDKLIDGKKFMIEFLKLGFNARAREKSLVIEKQKKNELFIKQEQERKKRYLESRNDIKIDENFNTLDHQEAIQKFINTSVLYDKNSPGCVSLDAFNTKYLTPSVFREVCKKTFNIQLTNQELTSIIYDFNDGNGNLDCQSFIIYFTKLGNDERHKIKIIQLEKQRKLNFLRHTAHERKMEELENKLVMNITEYIYSPEEKESAFKKYTFSAKKYDKNHPAAMSLDGFEQKYLKPHVFREMIKRTFGLLLEDNELNAIMHYFDKESKGIISSKEFLIHFLKVGISERESDHLLSIQKLRQDAKDREREHIEKMAAQWSKMELNLKFEFSDEDLKSALEKLTEASVKFDPASPGPMGLTAFDASHLSPAVFREMLKRSFNMKVTNQELAALISQFDNNGNKQIDCAKFMVRFTTLGSDKRSEIRATQLLKQRNMNEEARLQKELKKKAAADKMEFNVDFNYSNDDFNSALEKIRKLAANYDRSHPSAPSLQGFMGTNMKPVEFKEMMMRTFNMPLNARELGALLNFFHESKTSINTPITEDISNKEDKNENDLNESNKGGRINNQLFLTYFNKIQRDEQSKRHTNRITTERELIKKNKEYQESLIKKKEIEKSNRLHFTIDDENTFLSKFRKACIEYATDPSLFNEQLQAAFKGPSLPPEPFRDIFARIFLIKFSFSEIGVLLNIIDTVGSGVIEGKKFLSCFYKMSRKEEKLLLRESNEEIDINVLRTVAGGGIGNMSSMGGRNISPSDTRPNSTTIGRIENNDLTRPSTSNPLPPPPRPLTLSSVMKKSATTSSLIDDPPQSAFQKDRSKTATATWKDTGFNTNTNNNNNQVNKLSSHNKAKSFDSSNISRIGTGYIPPNSAEFYYHPYDLEIDTMNNEFDNFTYSTLANSWLLPSLTANTPSINTTTDGKINSPFEIRHHLKAVFDEKLPPKTAVKTEAIRSNPVIEPKIILSEKPLNPSDFILSYDAQPTTTTITSAKKSNNNSISLQNNHSNPTIIMKQNQPSNNIITKALSLSSSQSFQTAIKHKHNTLNMKNNDSLSKSMPLSTSRLHLSSPTTNKRQSQQKNNIHDSSTSHASDNLLANDDNLQELDNNDFLQSMFEETNKSILTVKDSSIIIKKQPKVVKHHYNPLPEKTGPDSMVTKLMKFSNNNSIDSNNNNNNNNNNKTKRSLVKLNPISNNQTVSHPESNETESANAGFFFPALLSQAISSNNKMELDGSTTSEIPNIGPVGIIDNNLNDDSLLASEDWKEILFPNNKRQ